MRLRFTSRASRDIVEIADYIKSENPTAALRVRDAILRTLENVTQFPEIGRMQELDGVRKLVVPAILISSTMWSIRVREKLRC